MPPPAAPRKIKPRSPKHSSPKHSKQPSFALSSMAKPRQMSHEPSFSLSSMVKSRKASRKPSFALSSVAKSKQMSHEPSFALSSMAKPKQMSHKPSFALSVIGPRGGSKPISINALIGGTKLSSIKSKHSSKHSAIRSTTNSTHMSNEVKRKVTNLKKLAKSGQAVVATGKTINNNTLVVLKKFKHDKTKLSIDRARNDYQREVYIHKLLASKGCSKYITPLIGEYDKSFTIAYLWDKEFVDMHAYRTVPFQVKINMASNLLSGLNAIHKSGVAHRDLKLGNILATVDGRIRFIDFGLSCENKMYTCDDFCGTYEYMSPRMTQGKVTTLEQAKKADKWAIGIVLYRLFIGRLPWYNVRHFGLDKEVIGYDPKKDISIQKLKPAAKRLILSLLNTSY